VESAEGFPRKNHQSRLHYEEPAKDMIPVIDRLETSGKGSTQERGAPSFEGVVATTAIPDELHGVYENDQCARCCHEVEGELEEAEELLGDDGEKA